MNMTNNRHGGERRKNVTAPKFHLKPVDLDSARKNSGSGQIRVGQFGQCQNSDEKLMSDTRFFSGRTIRTRVKSGSDNRNIKNVMSGLKIRTKNSCPYPVFSGSDKFGYSGRTNFCQH